MWDLWPLSCRLGLFVWQPIKISRLLFLRAWLGKEAYGSPCSMRILMQLLTCQWYQRRCPEAMWFAFSVEPWMTLELLIWNKEFPKFNISIKCMHQEFGWGGIHWFRLCFLRKILLEVTQKLTKDTRQVILAEDMKCYLPECHSIAWAWISYYASSMFSS